MKFSEAMRAGAALRPQCQGAYATEIGTCALGAALEGGGLLPYEWLKDGGTPELMLLTEFMTYMQYRTSYACSACSVKHANDNEHDTGRIWNVVTWLNDRHGWTREQIADWLESLEM